MLDQSIRIKTVDQIHVLDLLPLEKKVQQFGVPRVSSKEDANLVVWLLDKETGFSYHIVKKDSSFLWLLDISM